MAAFPTPSATDAVSAALSTIILSAAAADTAMSFSSSPPPDSLPSIPPPQGECQLVGPFALLVQAALGGLALLSLVFKRWRERPQRPVKIWFFDASKQVFGSVLVHIANVVMSVITYGRVDIKMPQQAQQAQPHGRGLAMALLLMARGSGAGGRDGMDPDPYMPNPCSFYLLNLAIDTTVGIPVLIVLLRVFTGLVGLTGWGDPPESIQSGHYGHPPRAWWWLKQSVIYFCGLFGMKLVVLFIFILVPWISRVGDWALGWTEGDEKVQIVFVMMLFPLIMNGLQYYIIDSFIKKKPQQQQQQRGEHQPLPGEDPDELPRPSSTPPPPSSTPPAPRAPDTAAGADGHDLHRGPATAAATLSPTDSHHGLVSDDERSVKMRRPRRPGRPPHEYNPDVDGDTRTPGREGVASDSSSASSSGELGKLLPPELYPAE